MDNRLPASVKMNHPATYITPKVETSTQATRGGCRTFAKLQRPIAWIIIAVCFLGGGCNEKPNALWGNVTTSASSQGNRFAYRVHGSADGEPIACVMERFEGSQPMNAIKWSSESRKDGTHDFLVNGAVITPLPGKVQLFVFDPKRGRAEFAVPLSAAAKLGRTDNPTPDDLEKFWREIVDPKMPPSPKPGSSEGEAPPD